MSSASVDLGSTFGTGGSSGVSTLNGLAGALTLIPGANVVITPSGSNITIAFTGTVGTVTSVGLVDGSTTPIYSITNSPVTTSGNLTFSLATQSANKVFAGPSSGGAAQPSFRSLVTADLSGITFVSAVTGTSPIVSSGGSTPAISIPQATSLVSGYLSNGDWSTFNSKQAAGNYITALSGDVVATGPGSVSATIQANVVTNAKLAQMNAMTIKGNNTAGLANALDLTVAQVNAILPVFSSSLNGLAPSSGGGTTNFLRADGTWTTPISGTGTVTSVAMTVPTFLSVSGSPITTSGTFALSLSGSALAIANGGTSAVTAAGSFNNLSPLVSTGDIIYESAPGVASRLAIGTPGQVLSVSGGIPAWASVGSGTVTSVAMTVPTILSVSGSPITTSGTLALSLANQNANSVFAGPVSGGASTPAFRALVSADIPTVLNSLTSATSLASVGTITTGVWNGTGTAGNSFITSGTTYTTPAGVSANTQFKFTLQGAGAGGASANSASAHSSTGGAGGTCIVYLTGLAASTGYTIAIGAAGSGGASGATGSAGGSTTLTVGATTYTASGGSAAAAVTGAGGTGGTATNGTIDIQGASGGGSMGVFTSSGMAGGNSILGFGGAGIALSTSGNGNNATGFGAGGGGASGNGAPTGGNGSAGAILVEWWN